MNKLLRYLAISALAAMPLAASAEIAGSGTATDPYQIATADDLCNAWSKVVGDQVTYFVQTADIDMAGVTKYTAVNGNTGGYTAALNYDGQNHIIKNFKPTDRSAFDDRGYYCCTVFGVASGTFKNLGIVDCDINTAQGAGALGAYALSNSAPVKETLVENVYVTGKITGSTYTGGLFGTTDKNATGKVVIKNCFVNANISSSSANIGGIIGRAQGHPITIINSYVAGTVNQTALVVNSTASAVTVDNVVAFNTGATAAVAGTTPTGTVTLANTDENKAAGIAAVQTWPAFSKTELINGFPALYVDRFQPTEVAHGLTMTWNSGVLPSVYDNWSGGVGENPRFATAYKGKFYTINNKTQSIAQITGNGLVDVYKLPASDNSDDFYGAALSVDEKGNFLVGKNFNRGSSTISGKTWAIYNPATGEIKHFELSDADLAGFRVDCLGRVLGDLTKEAYFFIADNIDNTIKIVKVTGTGSIASTSMAIVKSVPVTKAAQQSYAQSPYNTLAEAGTNATDFYYNENNSNLVAYIGGQTNEFAPEWSANSYYYGFATFTIDGKRYFVGNAASEAKVKDFGIIIMNEEGYPIASYVNDKYVGVLGYPSIVAEVNADKTATIYAYNCNGNNSIGSMAATFVFDPSKADAAVVPVGKEANPYKISTPEDLVALKDAITFSPFYAELENDIDMAGINFVAINTASYVNLDGKYHVIKNLTSNSQNQVGLFWDYKGTTKNLGFENVNLYSNRWGCAGPVCGYARDAVVENCYSTGTIIGYYAGGIIGGVGISGGGDYHAVVKDCYSSGLIKNNPNDKGFLGGIIGRCTQNNTVSIENCFFMGTTTGSLAENSGAGILGGTVDNTANVTISNVVTFSDAITGVNAIAPSVAAITVNNAFVWENTHVNGVKVAEGKTLKELQDIVTGWEAFNDKVNQCYPVLAWQEADGVSEIIIYGTEDKPYVITTPEELAHIAKVESSLIANVDGAKTFYVELANDIDMTGVAYAPFQPTIDMNFDGKGHVISNFVCKLGINERAALIESFHGVMKNIGIKNSKTSSFGSAEPGNGVSGTLIGYVLGKATVENCYAENCETYAYYSGGLVAGVEINSSLSMKNCYVAKAFVDSPNGFSGGLVGPTNAGSELSIENSYIKESNVRCAYTAGGITTLNSFYYGAKSTVNIKNVVVWNTNVWALNSWAAPSAVLGWDSQNDGNVENSIISNVTVAWAYPEGLVSAHHAQGEILSWSGYHLHAGVPVLAWQEADKEGLEHAPILVATSADGENIDGEYAEIDGNEYTLAQKAKYLFVKLDHHSYFQAKHKYVQKSAAAQASLLAAEPDADGFTAYEAPIKIARNGSLTTVVSDGTHNSERTILFDALTGIEDVIADDEAADAVYYNLQGVQVANPAAGVYVRVAAGKASKVYVK